MMIIIITISFGLIFGILWSIYHQLDSLKRFHVRNRDRLDGQYETLMLSIKGIDSRLMSIVEMKFIIDNKSNEEKGK